MAARPTLSALDARSGFEASREWAVSHSDGALILSGGAGELLALEAIDADTAAEIAGLWSGGPQPRTRRALEVAAQLADLGILHRRLMVTVPPRIAISGTGELTTAIRSVLAERLSARIGSDDADLLVLVRSGGRLVDLYRAGVLPVIPHLLIDAAYHHTFSIGPLVVPGDTACLACLAGRIGHRWGDPPAPERPAVQRNLALLADITALEVGKIIAGDLGLAGQTIAYDFERRRVIKGSVYRLPWCPVCGDGGEPEGRIVLSGGGS